MRIPSSFFLIAFSLARATAAPNADQDEMDAAEALLRWQISSQQISSDGTTHFFVSVNGHDLPSAVIAKLEDTRLDFQPGSRFKLPDPPPGVGREWKIDIGKAELRSDGTYEIRWDYYCGTRCASGNTAVMQRDSSGWHVLSSHRSWIS
jgi:hypothetical protein